ncbi:hypothetical protein ABVK25_011634 [Lepraria finkii]|uniref:Methyltransferase type 11 domain-containing protein n=1 Tax=Lepraria finkii TaxID=1340010 RepID=A0ABR4ALQ3_9LECA
MASTNHEQDSYVFNRDHKSTVRIWPLELSRELPGTARIDGFDISPAQYPHRNWLPANVILYVHNAFAPFPQEYAGVYDVVHVRFFVTLINEENVAGFIQNLMALLKPGGYLQWVDLDPHSCCAVTAVPESPKNATEKLVALMQKPHPDANYSWVPKLTETASLLGLQVQTRDNISMKDEFRPFWNQSNLLGVEDFGSQMEGEAAKEASRMIKTLGEEFSKGASVEAEFLCLVGVRPL